MPELFKAFIFLVVFAGTTAGVWAFIVPDTKQNPNVTAKGRIGNDNIDFSVTGNKAALGTDIVISKALALAIGFLIAVIVLFIL